MSERADWGFSALNETDALRKQIKKLEDRLKEMEERMAKIENHLWEKFGELP